MVALRPAAPKAVPATQTLGMAERPAKAQRARAPRRRLGSWWIAVLVLIIVGLAVLARYGPATAAGRQFIEQRLNGLDLGSVGRLGVEGLTGDPWVDPHLARLTLTDRGGVWFEARGLAIRWRPAELLERRLHIASADARAVTFVHRPTLAKTTARGGRTPVSIKIDQLRVRVEMAPEFATRRGLYDLTGSLDIERSGAVAGQVRAFSLMHAGDHVLAKVAIDRHHAFRVSADAKEAQGGALAGALGLAADQPFFVTVRAAGSLAEGQVLIDTHVGATSPVEARAAWNKSGGEAHGDVQLAASSLLARYSAMVGPWAHVDIAGRKAADRFSDFSLNAKAENATLVVHGQGDLGAMATGPRGVTIDARVGDANRLLRFPKMGAVALAGTLTGDPKHWVLVGAATVTQMAEGSYSLARVTGPVRLENHGADLLIQATPTGQGGAGQGLLAALLGASPSGEAELTRFADGRLLMRHLALKAVGLTAEGGGAMDLFGGLKFAGQANFSNLVMAHAGASGLVSMNWTAGQGGRSPWAFTVDAHGRNFGVGFAEADRLLGRTPHLVAQASYSSGVVTVAQATLTGAAGETNGIGTVGFDGAMGMKLAWQARGPFVIGPVEIDGAAKGSGDLTGTLDAPRVALVADFGSLATPLLPLSNARVNLTFQHGPAGTDGQFALSGTSAYGPAQAASGFRFAGDGVDLTALSLKAGGVTASGDIALRKGEPSSADLTLAAGPGVLLTQGHAEGRLKVAGGAGGGRAEVSLKAGEAILRDNGVAIKSLDVTADGPLSRLPYKIAANGPSAGGPWRLRGGGDVIRQGDDRVASFSGAGRVRRADFHTLSPAQVQFGAKGFMVKAAVGAGGGRADLDFVNLDGAANVKATLADVDMSLLNEDYVGKISGQLTLAGRGDQLAGGLDARLAGAGGRDLRGAPPVNGEVTAKLAGNAMNVAFHLGNNQGFKAVGDVALPVDARAAPFSIAFDYHRPLKGRFTINGEIKPVWDLVVVRGGADSLSGQVNADVTLGGTLADPIATGAVALDGGRFQDEDTGLRLETVSLRANLAGDAVDVSRFVAVDGVKGQISGSGRASLLRDGASSFRADITGFRLIDTDLARATASGHMTVNRAADGKVRLTGALTIDKAQISPNPPVASGVTPMDVVEIHRPDAFDDQPAATPVVNAREAPVALDVSIRAPGGVFLKGRGLNLEMMLDAHVGGTVADPVLTGNARVVRGDYDFAGQRFQLDERSLIYLGSTPQSIRLDLTATREDPSLTAVIRIAGTAAKPAITLTSNPALPQDEILSQVLFGASASQLSGLEAAQLASAVAGLSGGGGFDLIGGLRSLAHLDRLAVADSVVTGTTVSGGKYINDKLYLQLTGGGREGQGAQLEWRMRKHFSLVGKLGSQGDSQLAIRWRRSY